MNQRKQLIELKCVVVGDGEAGKTTLLTVYNNGKFSEEYVPTVCDNYSVTITVDNKECSLALWDTAGQESWDRLRTLSYPNTNVIVMCYPISRHDSFENVTLKWVPEVRHHCPGVPLILVACKKDLRQTSPDEEQFNANITVAKADRTKSLTHQKKFVTRMEGENLAKSIQAAAFIETSAKHNDNVSTVFTTAAEEALKFKTATRKTTFRCSLY